MFWRNNKAYIFLSFTCIAKAPAKTGHEQTVYNINSFSSEEPTIVPLPFETPFINSRSHLFVNKTKLIHLMWKDLQLIALLMESLNHYNLNQLNYIKYKT